MSVERHRCQFHPNCSTHIGIDRLLSDVDDDERARIVRKMRALESVTVVAREHGLTTSQVRRILSKARQGEAL